MFLRFRLLSALLRIKAKQNGFSELLVYHYAGSSKARTLSYFFFFLQVAVSRVEDRRIFFSLSQMEEVLRTASEEDCFFFSRFRMSVERNWEIGFGAVNMNAFTVTLWLEFCKFGI